MTKHRGLLLGALGMLTFSIICMPGMTARAADTVGQISITFKDEPIHGDAPREPDISTSTAGCEITDIEWARDVEKWKPAERVRVNLTIESSSLDFDSFYNKSKCSITGDGAVYVSARRQSDRRLEVHVDYYPSVWLGETSEAGWSDNTKTTAKWKKVPYATGYKLALYADDKKVKTLDVTGTSIDLSQYMTKEALYYYEVKACGKNSNDKKYMKEGDFITSDDIVLDDLGETDGKWKKSQGQTQYKDGDGELAKNQWRYIVGKWYYFNGNGSALTGLQNINGRWYYLDGTGVMQTGWRNLNGRWYYFFDDGGMAVGWAMIQPSCWYYFYDDGGMATGWLQVGGVWYYMADDGCMRTGWQNVNGKTYYLAPDGSMKTGWITGPDGGRYLMGEDGALQ